MQRNKLVVVTSEQLRARVTEYLGRPVSDRIWERAEPFARRKLGMCQQQQPDCRFYNTEYLVLVAADTVREIAFRDRTLKRLSRAAQRDAVGKS